MMNTKLFIPNISHKYRVNEKYAKFDDVWYGVQIYNGSELTTIIEQDFTRMNESLLTQMEMCTRRDDDLWHMYLNDSLSHKDILERMVRVIAFEIPGSFVVRISLPNYFCIKSGNDECNRDLDYLALNYCFEPQLDIIEKVRSTS